MSNTALVVLPSTEEEIADQLAKKASLAENAVKAVANGDTVKVKRKPKVRVKAKAKPKATTQVHSITPLPEIWAAAKSLANGNTKLLFTVSEDAVIVMNHPKQFTRKAGK